MVDKLTTVVHLGGQLDDRFNSQQNQDSKLSGDRSGTDPLSRMSAPFLLMKDQGKQGLQPLLQALFDNIDDALFEMADRAELNSEQNLYFESMREIRIKRRGMELGFGHELDNAFRQLLVPEEVIPTLESNQDDAIEGLSLVADDELEELVAVDSMVLKAQRQFSQYLKPFSIRLDTLINTQRVTVSNNPFGPNVLCHSFLRVSKKLDLDIKAKLVLFKLFDQHVMGFLEPVYQNCNTVLIENGILPSLEDRRDKAAGKAPDTGQGVSATPVTNDVFSTLQNLLPYAAVKSYADQNQKNLSGGLQAPGQAPQIPQATLMQLLQTVQQSLAQNNADQQRAAMQGEAPRQLDVQHLLGNILSSKLPDKPLSIGQVDDDAINLVAMLFQFILDDRNLASPMKALIARLQIPIIKVAMLDKSFFSKGGHPARKLLNEIANASLGWSPAGLVERDPLYKKVESVVERLLSDLEVETSLFQEVLTDFIAFLEMDKRRTDLIQQRTVNAEDGRAKSELARTQVQRVLNEKVAGKSLPKVVINLLEEAWSNVLFLVFLKNGTENKNWHDALQVVDELLWSVQPMKDNESRQRLLVMVPKLLKNIRAGLTQIGFDLFNMNQLFADLEMIHLSQLQDLSHIKLAVDEPLVKPVAKAEEIDISLDELLDERSAGEDVSLEDLDVQLDQQMAAFDALADQMSQSGDALKESKITTRRSGEDPLARQVVEKLAVTGGVNEVDNTEFDLPADDPSFAQVDALKMGNWLELHQEDDKKFRCRLAAIIRSTGKYIFVNRSGMKVAEYNRVSLAHAIKQGRLTSLDEGLLFDRALESVIGNLRSIKTAGA